jgi:hypothetical protein
MTEAKSDTKAADAKKRARERQDKQEEMQAKVEEGAARGVKINPLTGEEEGPLPTAHQSSEAANSPNPHLPLAVPSTTNPVEPEPPPVEPPPVDPNAPKPAHPIAGPPPARAG